MRVDMDATTANRCARVIVGVVWLCYGSRGGYSHASAIVEALNPSLTATLRVVGPSARVQVDQLSVDYYSETACYRLGNYVIQIFLRSLP